MENYYAILGVNTSATHEEIRRAYRILARRYHPDVNPGKASEEKFKAIAEAYTVLSDPEKRRVFDAEFERDFRQGAARSQAHRAYQRDEKTARERYARAMAEARARATKAQSDGRLRETTLTQQAESQSMWDVPLSEVFGRIPQFFKGLQRGPKKGAHKSRRRGAVSRVSVLEVSCTIKDAIIGVKKTIEIAEPEGTRKVSVKIPAGTKSGTVIRLQNTQDAGEELVLIVRVAAHPYISLQNRGVIVEVPITIGEAINGANITIPTLEDQMVIKVPAGSQTGHEVRLKERGIVSKDGTRGDLFIRLMVQVPDTLGAVGLNEKAGEFERYYSSPVRKNMPKTLLA